MNNKNGSVVLLALIAISSHAHAQPASESGLPEQCLELGVEDHTMVIESVLDNADILYMYADDFDLDTGDRSFENMSYTLYTLLEVAEFAEEPSYAMETAAHCLEVLDASDVNEETYQKFLNVSGDISEAREFQEIFTILEGFQESNMSHGVENDGLADAVTVAQRILDDGQATIYNADLEVYSTMAMSTEDNPDSTNENGDPALDMAKADTKGAIVGGISGCAVAGPGCLGAVLPSAAAGAIGGSVLELLNHLWD